MQQEVTVLQQTLMVKQEEISRLIRVKIASMPEKPRNIVRP
ncbi:hypothetical protein PHLH7_31430 [Pseudomonas sp. Ost2]|nr:hypothetical protein PHLH7_31430 [Pseudomonas sp. Ost2]